MEAVCKRVVISAQRNLHPQPRRANFSFGHFDRKLGDAVIDRAIDRFQN